MKKILALVLALAMMAVHACSAIAEQPTYHFEIVSKGFQSTYWQAVLKGTEARTKEINDEAGYEKITFQFVGPDAESNVAQQVSQFESAVNANPAAIGFAAVDQEAFVDLIAQAQSKNIPIIGFDSGVPGAPEGAVYANASTDNYAAGGVAAEGMWAKIKDRIAAAEGQVRIGEVNQEATGESVTNRGKGFIDKIIELAAAEGWGCAVIGNEYYVNGTTGAVVPEADAKIIIEVRVPSATYVDLCATEASVILNEEDTIAIFGSNQVAAEGVLVANESLYVCGSGDDEIIAVGFDSGSTIKAAVSDGTMYGAVTQAPVGIGRVLVDLLLASAEGQEVKDTDTGCAFYTAENINNEEIAQNLYD